ncbi:hypothetical protein CDD83_10216 [Cordyceps sp. RAO-2017]|nr:hypothetical protein CDD83_10216 [Cordyceps sp. RAO-2017]
MPGLALLLSALLLCAGTREAPRPSCSTIRARGPCCWKSPLAARLCWERAGDCAGTSSQVMPADAAIPPAAGRKLPPGKEPGKPRVVHGSRQAEQRPARQQGIARGKAVRCSASYRSHTACRPAEPPGRLARCSSPPPAGRPARDLPLERVAVGSSETRALLKDKDGNRPHQLRQSTIHRQARNSTPNGPSPARWMIQSVDSTACPGHPSESGRAFGRLAENAHGSIRPTSPLFSSLFFSLSPLLVLSPSLSLSATVCPQGIPRLLVTAAPDPALLLQASSCC